MKSMKRIIVAFAAVAVLIVVFDALPTAKGIDICIGDVRSGAFGNLRCGVRKSDLRIAIEERLHWLGVI